MLSRRLKWRIRLTRGLSRSAKAGRVNPTSATVYNSRPRSGDVCVAAASVGITPMVTILILTEKWFAGALCFALPKAIGRPLAVDVSAHTVLLRQRVALAMRSPRGKAGAHESCLEALGESTCTPFGEAVCSPPALIDTASRRLSPRTAADAQASKPAPSTTSTRLTGSVRTPCPKSRDHLAPVSEPLRAGAIALGAERCAARGPVRKAT